jgi:hypothetical protein
MRELVHRAHSFTPDRYLLAVAFFWHIFRLNKDGDARRDPQIPRTYVIKELRTHANDLIYDIELEAWKNVIERSGEKQGRLPRLIKLWKIVGEISVPFCPVIHSGILISC